MKKYSFAQEKRPHSGVLKIHTALRGVKKVKKLKGGQMSGLRTRTVCSCWSKIVVQITEYNKTSF